MKWSRLGAPGYPGSGLPSLALGWGLSAAVHGLAIAVLAWSGQPPAAAAGREDPALPLPVEWLGEAVPAPEVLARPFGGRPANARPSARRSGRVARGRRTRPIAMALAGEPPRATPPAPGPRALANRPASPVLLEAAEARALRVHDEFPVLPESLRSLGARHSARVKICVSTAGTVAEVTVEPGVPPPLARTLVAAIRGWRSRPHLVDGIPAPFCQLMSLDYRVNATWR
jgi:hypothetical protein